VGFYACVIIDIDDFFLHLFFHFPLSLSVAMEDFLKQASKSVPTLVGVKFSSSDSADLRRCMLLDEGRFQMLYGRDEV
jgi:N-acetylneuraminate lyase